MVPDDCENNDDRSGQKKGKENRQPTYGGSEINSWCNDILEK